MLAVYLYLCIYLYTPLSLAWTVVVGNFIPMQVYTERRE